MCNYKHEDYSCLQCNSHIEGFDNNSCLCYTEIWSTTPIPGRGELPRKGKEMPRATKATAKPAETDVNVSYSPEDWEWETVAEESPTRVVFDTLGDTFVGQYVGDQHIEQEPDEDGKDQSFDLFLFRGRDSELYAVNHSYKLIEAMEKVTEGDWVRIVFVKEIPSKRGNPLKDFRVDVKK